jgi:hypothetical protein
MKAILIFLLVMLFVVGAVLYTGFTLGIRIAGY